MVINIIKSLKAIDWVIDDKFGGLFKTAFVSICF